MEFKLDYPFLLKFIRIHLILDVIFNPSLVFKEGFFLKSITLIYQNQL